MSRRTTALVICMTLGSVALDARAADYTITAADRSEIEELLHRFFDAARDGNAALAAQAIPTRVEFAQLFQPGTEPFVERHQRAIDRDVHDLREHFAGGTFVGLTGGFEAGATVVLSPCGTFGAPQSECASGPVIEWRAGAETRRMRVDRLVRIHGHWKIFDPRL
jgi:hypothetical protein